MFSDEPATLVQAQVGSGKTTVLVHKLLWLHVERGVPLDEVAVLTFTRRAADEIRARVRDLIPEAEAAWDLLGTFHGVARALLARERRAFEVLDARGRDDVWSRLIAEHELDVKYVNRLTRRWEAWRQGRRRFGNMKRSDDMDRLVELFAEEKRRRGLLDFDDLLAEATRSLPTASPPAWILIDELQDCSQVQLDFAERLAGPETRWFAVGDPDQVIYSWRGGSPRLFQSFRRRRRARTLDLPRNYRSTATIVECAQAFLSGRPLQATRPPGEPLRITDHHDPGSEVAYLLRRFQELRERGCPWGEIGVFTRTQRQLTPLADGLRRGGVPCATPVQEEGPAVRWLRALLRAGLEDDALLACAALSHERYGILGARWAKRARRACRRSAATGLRCLGEVLQAELERCTEPRRGRALRAARSWVARLQELPVWLAVHSGETWDAQLRTHLEVGLALGPTASTYPRDLAAVSEWLARQRAACARRDPPLPLALRDLLRPGGAPQPRSPRHAAKAAVQLLTVHASKGLEFRHVFLCGANQGSLPLASAWRKPAALREERRLFFVALTRARDTLEISWYRAPVRPDVLPEPSAFLDELPEHCVQRADAPTPGADGAWAVGARVRHRKYGLGRIEAIEGTQLRCRFDAFGPKSFSTTLCPLTPEA